MLMLVKDDVETTKQIGKFTFTVRAAEDKGDGEQRRQRRIEALTRLLLVTWRLERGERTN
jgi:hypothetical protein